MSWVLESKAQKCHRRRHTELRDFGDGLTVSSRALVTTELLVFIFSALILSCIHHSCWAVIAGASVNPKDLCLYAKVITFHSIWLVFLWNWCFSPTTYSLLNIFEWG